MLCTHARRVLVETAVQWNSLETVKLIASFLTPVIVAVVGYWFNRRLKEIEENNQKRNQAYIEEKEKRLSEIERRYDPHIEFTIDCNIYGPQEGAYIAELLMSAHNKSLVQHKFKEIILRVRGIKHNEALSIWEKSEHRLKFPNPVFERDVKPENWNFIFIEPSVKQEISFITKIEETYRFIVARAEFHYDKFTPHSIERMFEICRTPVLNQDDER
jgi:hypothetical protein